MPAIGSIASWLFLIGFAVGGGTGWGAVAAAATARAPAIAVDSAWLARRGPGLYLLDQPGATYTLAADVRTTGTAFVIAAPDVTLDLNGHTITYNDAAPLAVANGDFESGPVGGGEVAGWDISGAAGLTIRIVPNDVYMSGSHVLRWTVPDGSGPQVIRSSRIAIPRAGRAYTASVITSGLTLTQRGVRMALEVVDATTDRVERHAVRHDPNIWQANGATFSFIPATPNPVYLRLTAVPGNGTGDATFSLDRAVVSPSMDYGVLASTADRYVLGAGGDRPAPGGPPPSGVDNLPVAMRTSYRRAYSPRIRDSAGTGRIVQGRAGGAFCSAIMARNTSGAVRIEGVRTFTRGDDISPIDALSTAPTDSRLVSGCAVDFPGSGMNITVRSALYPAIDVAGPGPAVVERCVITNNPLVGIRAGQAAAGVTHVVRENVLRPNTVISNGYAIFATSGVRVLKNTIQTDAQASSRGIYIGGPAARVEVAGNRVDVRERASREYGDRSPIHALRIRDLAKTRGFADIYVHDNIFVAHAGAGCMQEAIGGRINEIPAASTGIRFVRNTFKAVIDGPTDPGPQYRAKGFVCDDCYATAQRPILLANNVFESDEVGLRLGYMDGSEKDIVAGLLFRDNEIRKSNDGVSRPFTSWVLGYANQTMKDVGFFGTSFSNGATDAIAWEGEGPKRVVFGRSLTVSIADDAGKAIGGATIRVVDADGVVVGSGTTDARGSSSLRMVTDGYDGTGRPAATSRRGPFRLDVSKEGYQRATTPLDASRGGEMEVRLKHAP